MIDQTEVDWLRKSLAEQLGTGLYLLRKGQVLNPQRLKKMEPDVTYQKCVDRGEELDARAIKWVPHFVAKYFELEKMTCGSPCEKTCVEPGCICDEETKTCR